MFKSLFSSKLGVPPAKLPQINAFIDAIVGGRPVQSATVESIGLKTIVTKGCLGRVGETAVLVYTSASGRYRAQTKITAATAATTHFELPNKVTLVGAATAEQKRSSVRLDTLVTGSWRFAPGGVGTGEFVRGTIRDISRGGCSLICERAIKLGGMVEVSLPLKTGGAPPLVLLGEVMRQDHIAASGKQSHGLRFHGVRPEEDQAIVEFINRKQADLRNRGLA